MSVDAKFQTAAKMDRVGAWIFWIVTGASAVLLFDLVHRLQFILEGVLILGAIGGITCGYFAALLQNQGNRVLRASQLSDAFGAKLQTPQREDYYNSPLKPSICRLASTTLENTLFSGEVVSEMLRKERLASVAYIAIFVIGLIYRGSSLGWVVFLAQTLFSADVMLHWLRSERFRLRTSEVHQDLKQFFLQGGSTKESNGVAIVLAAFADYECAKDEAAMPLDSDIFNRLNPRVSADWELLKEQLNIHVSQEGCDL